MIETVPIFYTFSLLEDLDERPCEVWWDLTSWQLAVLLTAAYRM